MIVGGTFFVLEIGQLGNAMDFHNNVARQARLTCKCP